jgi:hypothetical protein
MKKHIPLVILFLAGAATAQTFPFTLDFLPDGNTKAIVKHHYYTLEYSENHKDGPIVLNLTRLFSPVQQRYQTTEEVDMIEGIWLPQAI